MKIVIKNDGKQFLWLNLDILFIEFEPEENKLHIIGVKVR